MSHLDISRNRSPATPKGELQCWFTKNEPSHRRPPIQAGVYFDEVVSGSKTRFVPRSVQVDLEPGVCNRVLFILWLCLMILILYCSCGMACLATCFVQIHTSTRIREQETIGPKDVSRTFNWHDHDLIDVNRLHGRYCPWSSGYDFVSDYRH